MAISGFDNSFSLSIKKWADKVNGNGHAFTKKVILELDQRISKRSPVDTGRFKGNWQLGVNTVPTSFDNDKFDTKDDKLIGSTVAERVLVMPVKAAGHVYYLVNNLPYAKVLEGGHSQKAPGPGGIVFLTVLEFDQIVQKSLDSIKK